MRTFVALLAMFTFGISSLSAQMADAVGSPGTFATVDGTQQLYYEECGKGPKAVVLLHDGVVNSAVWDDVWPTLCKQFHVIRYDRRGYGRTPATKKPYFEADDLTASPQDHKHDDMPLPEKPVFPYVRDLRMPTLILIGSGDLADNQAVAGALVMEIPGSARVVVPDTGHLLYLEKPEVFSSLVIGFLQSHGF